MAEKLKMQTPNITEQNIEQIAKLFPNVMTESRDEKGNTKKAIDFELLKQNLSDVLVDDENERYRLDWSGKKASLLKANTPITKTLRPYREESVNFDSTENLYIEGDNFAVLKILQESYLGKIKMIYIDPPYNTGKDFIYSDKFKVSEIQYEKEIGGIGVDGEKLFKNKDSNGRFHSDWLSMMYERLLIARDLLKDDGVIFISIDEAEKPNLSKICNEIYGESNYAGDIVWKNSSKNDQKYISVQHEYILCYVKSKSYNIGEWVEKKEGLSEIYKAFDKIQNRCGNDWKEIHKQALSWYNQFPKSDPIYSNKQYSWMDENGVYFQADISGPNVGQYVYDVVHPRINKIVKAPSRGWFCPEEKLKKLIKENKIHFGDDETTVPCFKTYLKQTENKSLSSLIFKDGRAASKRLTKLFGTNLFTNPKDEDVLIRLFTAIDLKSEDIVLDFFSGSATTAHATFLYNSSGQKSCQFILVQIQEDLDELYKNAAGLSKKIISNAISFLKDNSKPLFITEIGKERIRRAGKKIIEENKDKPGIKNLDIGFRVYKTDSSNMKDVYYHPNELGQVDFDNLISNIKDDRTPDDLLTQVILDLGLELNLPIEEKKILENTVFIVQSNALVACFDDNIDFNIVDKIAELSPFKVIFKDASFKDDKDRINVEERFKRLSPDTIISVI
jgi:adenine-specific DNA-methyltransferase